jgi:hypothetical protein
LIADLGRGVPTSYWQVYCAEKTLCCWQSRLFRTQGEAALALADHRLAEHNDGSPDA